MLKVAIVLFIVGTGFITFEDDGTKVPSSSSTSEPIVVVEDDLVFVTWVLPDKPLIQESNKGTSLLIPGYQQTTSPGFTKVPYTAALMTVPINVNPLIEIVEIEKTPIKLNSPIAVFGEPDGVINSQKRDAMGGKYRLLDRQQQSFSQGVFDFEHKEVMNLKE